MLVILFLLFSGGVFAEESRDGNHVAVLFKSFIFGDINIVHMDYS